MRPYATALIALLLFGVTARAGQTQQPPAPQPEKPAVQQQQQQPPSEPQKPAEEAKAAEPQAEAAMSCGDCHEQAKAFVNNPHARGSVKKGEVSSDVCQTCHGDGTEHIAGGGDKSKINKPAGLKGSEETCMMCHDTATAKVSRHGSMHANSKAVNCLSCHSIHNADARAPHLVAKPQLQLCGTCHTQAASFRNRAYAHRLGEGGMECSSCHEPHGRGSEAGRSLTMAGHLKTTPTGESACVNCHTEKRGPFVFQHGGYAAADCTTCHDPHGSSNPKQLRRATVMQVCIECHSPIQTVSLGSQPPSFHNLLDARYQNCTTCHVAVHGSNRSPQLLK